MRIISPSLCYGLLLFCMIVPKGFAASHEPQIFWRSIHTANQQQKEGIGDLSARGSVVTRGNQSEITLTVINQGTTPVSFSYVLDEYVASTPEGRKTPLEKSDFFNYPTILRPGAEAAVALSVPKDLKWQDIAQIRATLNTSKITLILKPLSTFASTAAPAPASMGVVSSAATSSANPASQGLGTASEEASPVVSPTELPIAGVPVVVEFTQALGSLIKADLQWDKMEEIITLSGGDRRTFRLLPGPHLFRVRSRLPSIAETQVEIPLLVAHDQAPRILIEARPRLTGVELSVRVWENDRLMLEELFTPGTHDSPS